MKCPLSWNQDCWEQYQQPDISRWHHPNGRKWRELKSLLCMKEESEKAGLKLNSQKTKIMASGSIISWQIEEEKWKQWQIFFSWASTSLLTVTAAMKLIKRHLLLGRKAMTDLDSILKSRDITLLTKVCLAKALIFPVVMCGCERWTIKKTEHWRIDVFELWCWRRLLRVPWTARRSNQ